MERIVDVIVPVFKVEPFLNRCIESILRQTYTKFHLVLVDDGSPDRCGMICDEYAERDKRIHVIHKKNGGLSSARNAGLEATHHPYVTFVDSDDWLAPNFLEMLLLHIENTGADIVESGYVQYFDEKHQYAVLNGKEEVLSQKKAYLRMFRSEGERTNYYAWGRIYRRKVIDSIRFPDGKLFEDLPFNYYVTKNINNYAILDEPLYFYYMNNEGITRGGLTDKNLQVLEIWKEIWEDCKRSFPELSYFVEMNYKRAYMGLLSKYCRFGGVGLTNEKDCITTLQKHLRSYRRQLLKWNMPCNRKIILILLCIDYRTVKWPCQIIKRVRHI